MVNQVVFQLGVGLFSFDVSPAFLQEVTFEELHAGNSVGQPTGPQQVVHLEMPTSSQHLIRRLPGFESFGSRIHVLNMLKGGDGLKDAPTLWRERLHNLLVNFGLKALQADRSIY